MRKIIVWSGHHSDDIRDLIQKVYHSHDDLLILCPPRIKDISPWLSQLSSGRVEFAGDLHKTPSFEHESHVKYPAHAKFGLFSTGTENGEKLILYTNENFKASLDGIFSFFDKHHISTVFSYPQPYHIFGLSLGYLYSIIFKKKLITPSGAYSKEAHTLWGQTTKEHGQGLLTLGTPTHFSDAIVSINNPSESLTCIIGGARVDKKRWLEVQEKLKVANPSIGYGCSEASPGITHLNPGIIPENDSDIGFVLPNGKLNRILEDLYYEGPNVCLAIIHKDKIEFPCGKIKLTDSLEMNGSGHYFYAKRNTLILNRGGEKFSLEEIEALIKKELSLSAVALALPDVRLGFELGLVIQESFDQDQVLKLLSSTYSRSFNPLLIKGITQIPLNDNAKYNRHFCEQYLLEKISMTPVNTLSDYLPHRDQMVWIDYVLSASEEGGECLVVCDKTKHYFSDSGVRQSAFIEWMAQGYGFVCAQYAVQISKQQTLEKAFLVGVDKMTFVDKAIRSGDQIIVSVKKQRMIGPISYVEGKVYSKKSGDVFAEAIIKLFSA